VFFRGWFENQLIRYSTAYRTLSGKEYVRQAQQFDTTSQEDFSIRRQVIPTRMGSARQMLAFYLKAQRSMLRLYPEARYILSTQPMLNRFTGDFVDVYEHPLDSEAHRMAAAARSKVLEEYLSHFQEDWCTQKDGGPSFVYLFVNGALRLEQVVNEERARGRKVEYYNTGLLFPDAREERIPYFIDGVHLSDQGNDVLGKFYAERILAADSEQRSTSSAPH
jgi:hypothetical protein